MAGSQLDDKVAVVTGAGSGIGAAIAAALYEAGARVVVADISGAQELTAKRLGPGARAVNADVTSGTEVQAMFQTALDEFGRLDIVW